MKNKLPLDTILTLMRNEKLLEHGSDMDELVQLFMKNVKNLLSKEEVEYSLAQYLAKSKHSDTVHRNNVLRQFTHFMNNYGWNH